MKVFDILVVAVVVLMTDVINFKEEMPFLVLFVNILVDERYYWSMKGIIIEILPIRLFLQHFSHLVKPGILLFL